jgi:solute carrier family 12 (sodium/potassium/chloride transporter), member 2
VRSGLFTAFAEWAAKQAKLSHGTAERAWKPNILVPVEDPHRLRGMFEFLEQLAYPMGSIKLLGIAPAEGVDAFQDSLFNAQHAFMNLGIFTSATVMEGGHFPDDVRIGMQALAGSFFRPNILFLKLPKDRVTHQSLENVIKEAKHQRIGVAL